MCFDLHFGLPTCAETELNTDVQRKRGLTLSRARATLKMMFSPWKRRTICENRNNRNSYIHLHVSFLKATLAILNLMLHFGAVKMKICKQRTESHFSETILQSRVLQESLPQKTKKKPSAPLLSFCSGQDNLSFLFSIFHTHTFINTRSQWWMLCSHAQVQFNCSS